MTPFSAFILADGSLIGLAVCSQIWLFRTSTGSIRLKVAFAIALGILACWSPLAIRAILGFPQPRSTADLPDRFELFAEHSVDDISFDLWIGNDGEPTPLAVTVVPNKELRSALRQAQQKLGSGEPVYISRTPSKPSGDGRGNATGEGEAHAGSARTDLTDDGSQWTLNVPVGLPVKDGEQK